MNMSSSAKINVGVKNLLAKLMAEENITVVHRNNQAANFDMNKRVLFLPILKDMQGFTYNQFIGHEIGRALFSIASNTKGFSDAVEYVDKKNPKIAKAFLDLCESDRVNRLMLKKYPGLSMDFRKSYKKQLDEGIFGVDETTDFNQLPLADRVNIQSKLGSLVDIQFTEEEQKIFDNIQSAYTWDQTVMASKKLYDYCSQMENPPQSGEGEDGEGEGDSKKKNKDKKKNKNQKQNKKQKQSSGKKQKEKQDSSEDESDEEDESDSDSDQENEGDQESEQDGQDGEETDESGDQDGDGDEEGDGEDDGEGNEEGDDDGDSESTQTSTGISKSSGPGNERVPPSCSTLQAFERNAKDLINANGRTIEYFNIPTAKLDRIVVPYKKVINIIDTFYNVTNPSYGVEGKKKYDEFRNANKPFIDYMVQQFTLKKAADESQKITIAKTGMIDAGQLFSYKFNDDIFRRSAILPGEKNHAMVMFVDFSGSMTTHMRGTIEQALNTAMYCRKINVPFELYSFGASGDNYYGSDATKDWNATGDDFNIPNLRLRQYFGLGMSQQDFHKACVALYTMSVQYNNDGYYSRNNGIVPREESLGGTPLNETIVAAFTIVDNLRKKTKAQIVTMAVVTDGEGYPLTSKFTQMKSNTYDSILRDPVTKMEYNMTNREQTSVLIEALRDRTDTNAIGFYICSGTIDSAKSIAHSMLSKYDPKNKKVTEKEISNNFDRDNYYSIKNAGYEEYFVIAGGKAISTSAEDDVKITSEAKLISNAKMKSKKRVVLGRFVELMAKQSKNR